MSPAKAAALSSRRRWRMGLRTFSARPKLLTASAVGLATALTCLLFAPQLQPSSCAVAGWNAFCLLYLGLVFHVIAGKAPDAIRARSAIEDQGGAIILVLIVGACAASIGAVALELTLAKQDHGVIKGFHVAVAFVTVTLSWFLMQTVYALHYAHEYYAADPATGKDTEGLLFPGGAPPDYWDFLHFSVVIGVAAQTADVAFTDPRLRRLGTVHSLIAFVFNTLIVALTINLVAGLF